MIIGTKKLLELVKEGNLVEGLCKRELTNPEGSGFDLRVGEVYKLKQGEQGFMGIRDRSTPPIELIAKYEKGKGRQIILHPGEYRLIKTIEKVNIPEGITANFVHRTTTFRSGVELIYGGVPPGYSGELTFGIKNLSESNPFRFKLGARIIHIQFYETGENVSKYRGQWGSGHVSTGGKSQTQV